MGKPTFDSRNSKTFRFKDLMFWGFDLEAIVADYILPSVWTLIMRAIKCLKGVRWMPWR